MVQIDMAELKIQLENEITDLLTMVIADFLLMHSTKFALCTKI